ncbi:hypothetical protein RB195_022793 [Necator americanus]|uniref:C2HC/C3H-type domain-containing protein n=1 Tax=Necator americanus TaxID=51031 RepID=A0ABR1EGN1_NECAM
MPEKGSAIKDEPTLPCKICNRRFIRSSLIKHEPVCKKLSTLSRKPFDSGKQRATGSDITYADVVRAAKEREKLGGIYPRPLTNWKDRHETFIDAVSSSKKVDYAIKTGAPLPPPPRTAVPSDYVQCNYCGRNFSEKAAERHIPFCREQSTKKLTKSPAWPLTTKGKTVVKNEGASEILSETSQRRRMQSSSSFTWHNDDYTLRNNTNGVMVMVMADKRTNRQKDKMYKRIKCLVLINPFRICQRTHFK